MQRRTCLATGPVLRASLLAALLSSFALAAHGAAPEDTGFSFSGFGSAGLTHSNQDQADYTSSLLKGSGAGYSDKWSPNVDSRLGAQLSLNLNKQWSGVLQVVSEQQIDHSYRPVVEWANVKYQITPDLALRAGRVALPIFLAADYRKIGYAYPWARTPVEVYGVVPVSSSDGVDLSYRWQASGVKFGTQAFFGRNELKLAGDNRVKARKITGMSNTAEYGALSGRISAFSGEFTINIADDLFDGLRHFGPSGIALADKYQIASKRFNALTIGATYDPGNWFLMAEMGRVSTHSFLGDSATLYTSAGYRAGDFTPYLAYANARARSPTSDPGLSLTGLPPPLAAAAGQLNAGLNTALMSLTVQSTITAGVRWDAWTNTAIKLQFDRVRPDAQSRGTLINLQPGYRRGSKVNLTSVVLDFVF